MKQSILTLTLMLSFVIAPCTGLFESASVRVQAMEELDEKELEARKEHDKFVKEMQTLLKAAQDSGCLLYTSDAADE